jgi:hypothetical protein
MNPKSKLELYEAFAATKPVEFHGFMLAWVEKHPEATVEETVVAEVVAPIVEPVPEEAPVEPVKPQRKRKNTAVTSETEDCLTDAGT